MVQIAAEIVGIAGSYVENRQQKYEPFFSKDWAKLFLLLVLLGRQPGCTFILLASLRTYG
jgi:hypothetical protein